MKVKVIFYLLFLVLFSSCSTKTVYIRDVNPRPRRNQVLDFKNPLHSVTPEQAYLTIDDFFYKSCDWMPRAAEPLVINNSQFNFVGRYTDYFIQKVRENDYYWVNHRYYPSVINKAALSEIIKASKIDIDSRDLRTWDNFLFHLVKSQSYTLEARRRNIPREWISILNSTNVIADHALTDVTWTKMYMRHWVISNILAPAKEDANFFLESKKILTQLIGNTHSDELMYMLLKDEEDIDKMISLHFGNSFSFSTDLVIPQTNSVNNDAVAIVIGINDYDSPEIPQVIHAENCELMIRELLQNSLGYQEFNILPRKNRVFSKTTANIKTLVKYEIRDYLQHNNQTTLFVYINAHAIPLIDYTGIAIVPSDGDPNRPTPENSYPLDELYRDLANLNASETIIILDICFSDRDGSGKSLIKDASPIGIKPHEVATSPAFTEFLACEHNQLSNWYNEKNSTFFTYFFVKGLTGAADQETGNSDGLVTISEIKRYLQKHVSYNAIRYSGRPQNPVIRSQNMEKVLINLK